MNSPYLIGPGAGFVSAILFLSTAANTLLSIVLLFLVALPGFLAGFGWGWFAALLCGLTGAAIVGLILGPAAGLVYFVTLGLPVAVLCYLALLARPAEAAQSDDGQPALEWYPVGHLIAWAAIMAGCVAALSVPMLGQDVQTYRETARAYFDTVIVNQLPNDGGGEAIDKEKLKPLIDLLVVLLPATSAMVWLGIIATNLWAAGRLLQTSGRGSVRPAADVATMSYPRHFPLLFIAALLLTLAPGIVSVVATGFAGAFLLAYIFMGLTVIHAMARGSSMRPFLLTILYLSMFLIGWIALLVAMIGLGEPVLKLREKALYRNQPPGPTGE